MIDIDFGSTVRRLTMATGRDEMWEATSTDGRWHFRRLELTGTPWEVTHDDFPGWSMLTPSLPKARADAEVQLHLDLTVNLSVNEILHADVERAQGRALVGNLAGWIVAGDRAGVVRQLDLIDTWTAGLREQLGDKARGGAGHRKASGPGVGVNTPTTVAGGGS